MASLELTVDAPLDPANTDLTFTYNEADPALMAIGAGPAYLPASGHMSLWDATKMQAADRQNKPRRFQSVGDPNGKGDFIPLGIPLSAADLGFTESRPQFRFDDHDGLPRRSEQHVQAALVYHSLRVDEPRSCGSCPDAHGF